MLGRMPPGKLAHLWREPGSAKVGTGSVHRLLGANHDRGGLSARCPSVVDHHVPAVINEIAMAVARIRAEYLYVVGGFNVEPSPKHLFPRRAIHMNVLGCAAWNHHAVHHGLVARDTTSAQHDDYGKNANNRCQTSYG